MQNTKIGPYQFFEQERWDRFRKTELPKYKCGSYLVVLNTPKNYHVAPGHLPDTMYYTCLRINVRSTGHIIYTPVPGVIRLAEMEAPADVYDSVFLVDAPKTLVSPESGLNEKNFFKLVIEHYVRLWQKES